MNIKDAKEEQTSADLLTLTRLCEIEREEEEEEEENRNIKVKMKIRLED